MKRQVLTLQKYVLGEVSRSTQQQPIVQISLNVRLKCSLEILGIQAQPTHGPIYDLKSQLFAVMLEMIKASDDRKMGVLAHPPQITKNLNK